MTTNSTGKGPRKQRLSAGARPTKETKADSTSWQVWLICVLLAAATFAVFGRTVNFEFVNLDDGDYVFQNPNVIAGLTASGIAHAFTHGSLANWDPLTTLSHMLDCQLFGLKDPGGHHLTNVMLHAAAAVLLFLVLRQMTGAMWRSALVAALFAIHPLRVESVAWVTERKDVLSGLFFMLTLAAYVRYARKPGAAAYLLVVGAFMLALMSKAMVVTLPFILLLLDWWPLNRFARRDGAPGTARLLLEKAPLLVLSGAATAVSIMLQKQAHAVQSFDRLSLATRLGNALVSCGWYVGKMFWPSNLAVLYPYPMHGLATGEVAAGALVVAGISAAAIWWRRERPYLLVGWLWFLVMLLPVIGLVQLGSQARADRYTYLPQIGLYAALSWLLGSVALSRPRGRAITAGAAILALSALGVGAYVQTGYWQNSEKLWTHTLACTSDNAVADYNYGTMLAESGKLDEAIAQFQKAVDLLPDHAAAWNNLGYAYMEKSRVADAVNSLQRALAVQPDFPDAHNNLGRAYAYVGRYRDAAAQYELAIKEQPNLADAHFNYGNLFVRAGGIKEAINQYEVVLAIKPDHAEAQSVLATLLFNSGRTNEAIEHFEKALKIQPDLAQARDDLNRIAMKMAASAQAPERNGPRALELAQLLVSVSQGTNPVYLATLAAAQAETGQFGEAAANVSKAQKMAADGGETEAADFLGRQLKLYEAHVPYRETNAPAGTGAAATK